MSSKEQHPSKRKHSAKKQGFVLVLTLLVITALTGLVVSFSDESSVEMNLAGFSRDNYKATQMARSGIQLALALLDADDRTMDSLKEDWSLFGAKPFPEDLPDDASISAKIVDESGKLNVNYLIDNAGKINEERVVQFKRLFKALGIEENLLDPVLDWLDQDNTARLEGAETFYYMSLEHPYRCANSPLQTIEQIFLIKGLKEIAEFGEGKKKRLLDFLTIYSDGKVNINTAPKEVLQSLSEKLDDAVAEAIIEYRKEQDFLSIDDLTKVPGVDAGLFDDLKKWITVKSSTFSITAKGTWREATANIKAVCQRKEDGLKLIYWKVS